MKILKYYSIPIILMVLVTSLEGFAQKQPLLYQVVVRDQEGDKLRNEKLEAALIIRKDNPGNGEVVYRETHSFKTTDEGIGRLNIGKGNSNQKFSNITWDLSHSYFVEFRIENLLNTNYDYTHTSEIAIVSPALFAGTVSDFSDPAVDTSINNMKALTIKDDKVYLANGGVVKLPEFFENTNSLLIKTQKKDVSCYGNEDGAIDITVEGGFPPYTFQWSNGMTTKDIDQLKAGDYRVYVTDSKGFTAIKQITVNQPQPMEVESRVRDVSTVDATDGAIKLQSPQGKGEYHYDWSTSDTADMITGLAPGKYEVTVSSNEKCSIVKQFIVKEPLRLSFDKRNVTCYGQSNGGVRLNIEGGNPPYKIRWSNKAYSRQLENLSAGRYYVTVKDTWGYQVVDSVNILQPYPLKVKDSVDHIKSADREGEINLKVEGGIPPYDFIWSTGDTTKNLHGIKNGGYSVKIKDDNNCAIIQEDIFVYRIMKDPRDSQEYKVITIGNQVWMAENLNVGQMILSDDQSTNNDIIEKYCYNNLESNCRNLGGLYTWDEAAQYNRPFNKINAPIQGVCPDGWHLPSEEEWQTLSEFLGGSMVAGNRLKNSNYWQQPSIKKENEVNLNSTGFAAIPAGRIDVVGDSYYKGTSTSFWSASKPNSDKAWHRTITTRGAGFYRDASYTEQKYSVRCIKDFE